MSEANKTVIARMLDELFNRGNLAAVDEFYAPDYRDHSLEHTPLFGVGPDRDGFRELVRRVREGMSDMAARVDDMVAEGDRVAARVVAKGTHTGPFMGVPATGRRIELVDFHFWRLTTGRIVEHWNQYNSLEVLQSLGAVRLPQDRERS